MGSVAVINVGGPNKELNKSRFIMSLSFRNVKCLDTEMFIGLLGFNDDSRTKDDKMNDSIEKYLRLSVTEQNEVLNKCCTFYTKEESFETKLDSFEKKINRFDIFDITCKDEFDALKNMHKYSDRYLDKKLRSYKYSK